MSESNSENADEVEDKLTPYNLEYVSRIVRLKNNSSLCYLNSLIQSLMSCPAFNEYLIKNKKYYIEEKKNNIVKEYLKLYLAENSCCSTFPLLQELVSVRHKKGLQNNLSLNRQEDIYEGFVLLLETIDGSISKLFENRYQSKIHCLQCNHISIPGNEDLKYMEPSELVIDLNEENTLREKLNDQIDVEEYIKLLVQVPRDYKCEKCKAENVYDPKTKKIKPNVIQYYTLVRLSEIVVLLFKKYYGKKNIYFPNELEFMDINRNKLKYKIVAQMEHSGNMHGGHYTARCLRKFPENFCEKKINQLKETLANEPLKEKIKQNIQKFESLKEKKTGTFLFNDDRVQFISNGFVPTPDTYMVFYHLFK